jgi:hypothetical protein
MRRGPINRPKRRVFPLRIIIPLVFLIIGVGAAYSLVVGDRPPEPKPVPIIIPEEPDLPIDLGWDGGEVAVSSDETLGEIIIGPVDSAQNQPAAPSREDTFTEARVASYKIG